MKTEITWHKYPDEKPKEGIYLLAFDGEKIYQCAYECINGKTYDIYSYIIGDDEENRKATHWAEMPEGPKDE